MIARVSSYSALLVSLALLSGCQSDNGSAGKQPAPTTQPSGSKAHEAMHTTNGAKAKPTSPTAATAPKAQVKAIRIDAGAEAPLKDKAGNEWLADTGFTDGEIVDRGDVQIAGTDNPRVYQTEHFGMTSFSHPVPNGKYTVKLHFAETYEDVSGAGERVFTVTVEDKTIADVDPFKEAASLNKAVVKSADVEVKDGKLDIKFTESVQSPEINGIEIIPQ